MKKSDSPLQGKPVERDEASLEASSLCPAMTPAVVDPSSPDTSSYPGGKGAGGLSERIIRQMPPHLTYIEGFAGHAAVFRKKRPADNAILVDADPNVCEWLRGMTLDRRDVQIVCDSFIDWIASMRYSLDSQTLVNLDPPYLGSTRTCLLYDFEFHTEDQHAAMLDVAVRLPCMVMISGYASSLYLSRLQTWRLVKIPAMTRGGMREEHLWCNFDEPELLHDPRYAGQDFRQRENYKRRCKRWAKKFGNLDRRERQAVAEALVGCDRLAVEMALRVR